MVKNLIKTNAPTTMEQKKAKPANVTNPLFNDIAMITNKNFIKQIIFLTRIPLLTLLILPLFLNSLAAEAKQFENHVSVVLYKVERVVDGDTLKLSDSERVRLIGIDTPESKDNAKLRKDSKRTGQNAKEIIEMGKRAADFTRKLVDGKEVKLEFDVSQRDKYGRLLAYVYLIDGTFVNAEIIKQGFAQVMTIPPNVKYQDLFLKLQKEARENKRGLWR